MPRKGFKFPTEEQIKGGKKRPRRAGGTKGQRIKVGAQCGAQKRNGGACTLAAGWGTSHQGTGRCKLHGGSTPTHVASAARGELRQLLGHPLEINPLDALLMCIRIRAGEVEWLSNSMAELDSKAWVEETIVGKQFHLYARERQSAMNDLARFSQMAISLGIAERAVKMAETYGEMLAAYTKGILDDLWPHLDTEGRAKAPQIVRQHLIALDGVRTPAQIPEKVAA